MRRPPPPGLTLVAVRELRWMRRDRLALFLAIGVPIIAFVILSGIFSNAVVRNLRVSVVDADRSATSLTYIQAIASAPGVRVAQRSGDMTSAMHAIRSGDAIAAVYIPEHFERDLIDRKRPQIVVLLQPAIFFTRQQRFGAHFQRGQRGDGDAAGHIPGGPEILLARLARRRGVRAHQSGAELRAVPAQSDPAARSPRHRRDRRRLCGRLGVLEAQPARMAARSRRQPANGARRQARAPFRHLHSHDGCRRLHHSWPVRRDVPRRLADHGRGRLRF